MARDHMIVIAQIEGKNHTFDVEKEIDISIPVRFDAKQFKAFGAPPARSEYYSGDDFTVSVNSGAGCNCPVFTFAAHLHGTHTECVGHISEQAHILQDTAHIPPYLPATLVTLTPINAGLCEESYDPPFEMQDMVITRAILEQAIFIAPVEALVIRTAPNDASKLTRDYGIDPPPFFTHEAMEYIVALGVKHLLVDFPSVDRLSDDGKLSNHHIFWGVAQGSNDVPRPSSKTITEFIFVPDHVRDGAYVLNINAGNIRSDAAPSRPVLYEILS